MCAVGIVKRFVVLVGVVAAGLGAMLWMREPTTAAVDPKRLTYVATAEQLGIVGYRDPAGAVSLDGQRIVIAEGRRLFELPVGGGARVPIAIALGQIRHVVADGRPARGSSRTPGLAIDGGSRRAARRCVRSSTNARRSRRRRPASRRRRVDRSTSSASLRHRRMAGSSPASRIVPRAPSSGASAIDGTRAEMQRVADRIAWPAWTPNR